MTKMMGKKALVDPEITQESLRNLRDELEQGRKGSNGDIASIVMKINSCLFSQYPAKAPDDDKVPDSIRLQSLEFDACAALMQAFNNLPAVVDDDYPLMRRKYEHAVEEFLQATAANGRGSSTKFSQDQLDDLISHKFAWETALQIVLAIYTASGDSATESFYKHELEVFRRVTQGV